MSATRGQLRAVSHVRELPNGKVLVHDNTSRRLVLYDANLVSHVPVFDALNGGESRYGAMPGGLLAWNRDSTLFVDPASLAFVVLDGTGSVVGVRAVPFPDQVGRLIGGLQGTAGFDGSGRLVYRASASRIMARATGPGVIAKSETPDSVPIVRVELSTRRIDTVTFVRTEKQSTVVVRSASGEVTTVQRLNPLQHVDDWVVTSDGRIVVLRGDAYRAEAFGPDGRQLWASRIPFSWRRLDDSAKASFVDSVRVATAAVRQRILDAVRRGESVPVVDGLSWSRDGVPSLSELQYARPDEMPDFAPAFYQGSAIPDLNTNVWVRTSITVRGESVYDVIGDGKVTDRVRVPAGRVIIGFGAGGAVYLAVRVASDQVRMEKALIR